MEYCVLRWTGLPSEDLPNVSNMFMKSLLDPLAHGSSYFHDNYLSIFMLIVRSLRRTTLGTHVIPPRPRGKLSEDHPHILRRHLGCTLWFMNNRLELMADLSSHQYIWRLTSVLTHIRPHHIGWTLRQLPLQLVLVCRC